MANSQSLPRTTRHSTATGKCEFTHSDACLAHAQIDSEPRTCGEEFPLPLHRSREIDARNIQTGKRERTQPPEHDYGEVQRRKARGGWTPTYFTQARKRQKRDDIQMGAATLARVTGGGYDHRDGGHARRKRLFAGGGRRANKAGRHQ